MSANNRDVVLDHCYDGIQEYDNPTPGWWTMVFLGSVVFSVAYFMFFTFGSESWTNVEEHDAAVAANMRLQFGEIGDLNPDEATLQKFMNDPKWVLFGKTTFLTWCTQCHMADGSGAVGPNLTDDRWKNVRKLEDIPSVIANGAAGGAMPAWKTRLHRNEIVLVAAYVASLRGQNLPSSRPPEGDVIPPWPKPGASSATSAPAAAPAGAVNPEKKDAH